MSYTECIDAHATNLGRLRTGCVNAAGACVVLTVFGLVLLVMGRIQLARVAQAEQAEPARFEADLSMPGVYEAPFEQADRFHLGQDLWLDVPPMPASEAEALLAGLKAEVSIVAPDGTADPALAAPDDRYNEAWERVPGQMSVRLVRLDPPARGSYRLRLTIHEPAPALAGSTRTLVVRNRVCGCMSIPGALMQVGAAGLGVIVLLIGIPTFVTVARHGWRRPMRTTDPPTTAEAPDPRD